VVSASASVARTSGLSEVRTLAPLRDPDRLDRTRGTGTGGVTADRIGFSRELSLPQRRQVERQSGLQGVANSVGRNLVRGEQTADTMYGRDGRLVGAGGSADPAAIARQATQSARSSQATAAANTSAVVSGEEINRNAGPQRVSPVAGDRQSVAAPRKLADQQVQARSDNATQTVMQSESRIQQRIERSDAAASLAQRLGEAQNIERPRPVQGQNEAARQRLELAYQPVPMAVAAKLSVFA
jgi:hypothetical protein